MTSLPFRRTGWQRATAAVVITVSCMIGQHGVAAQTAATSPATASTPVADRVARIDQFLQQYVDNNQVAGLVALVLQDGQPVYEKALGWRDKEAGDAMRVDSIFVSPHSRRPSQAPRS
jgi:CubicO group peptidase (beta-lactamase class C family)